MSKGFILASLTSLRGPFPTYARPVEVTSYSHDANRTFHHDDRALSYYHAPSRDEIDLSRGYPEGFIERDPSVDERLDGLCRALREEKQRASPEEQRHLQADIISFRGVMTKIMCTPYERREGYTLRVSRYHNTIYLCQEAPSQAPPRKLLPTHHRMTYGGYRFEGYCTLPALPETLSPEEIRRTKEDATVDTHIEYCSVFRTRLGQHRLIMGAEVDCCVGPKPPRDEAITKYVELKTSKLLQSDRDIHSFERYKLLKYWAQSFLPGIPRVVVGFRDQEGQVRKLQTFQTLEIPRMVRGKPGAWDPSVCLRFVDALLEWVRAELAGAPDDYRVVNLLRFDPIQGHFTLHPSPEEPPFLDADLIDPRAV